MLREALFNADLLRIKTDGGFVGGGYVMYSDVGFIKNIGTSVHVSTVGKEQ